MKSTAIDPSVVGGQGCIGSYTLNVPNPAPGVVTSNGGDAGVGLSSGLVSSDAATTGATMPDQYGPATNGVSGPTGEPPSIYQPNLGKAQGA